MGCVYMLTNTVNNKRYIGKTNINPTIRIAQHIQHSRLKDTNGLLHKAIAKYGIHKFDVDVLFYSDDYDYLSKMEILLIRWLDTMSNTGYNLTCGGEGSSIKHISEAHKNRLRIINQGKHKGKTSKYSGVHLMPITGKNKWRAVISCHQRPISLGCFSTEEEAALMYNKVAIDLYGPSAKLNKII